MNPLERMSDDAVRRQVVDAVLAHPAARGEIIDRLMGAPADRGAILGRLLGDDAARVEMVRAILANDRGRALVVNEVVADDAGAKTFIRMLMTTGMMGASLSQRQADALGYGDAYAFGNRRRTMSDLKRLGAAVDAWAREHGGRHPACAGPDDVGRCLARALPPEVVASIRTHDAWGAPYQYLGDAGAGGYILLSFATDGMADGLGRAGPTDSLDCDIVFSNGAFVQWPGSLRPEEIP